jgi:hypothetical protein
MSGAPPPLAYRQSGYTGLITAALQAGLNFPEFGTDTINLNEGG